ncbi:hydroxymyristoyl-ACP dehydratase [Salinisphaera hydrothermalis]|uniref:hydroxymyristoyl-ACP dehydratase n=1 Tax=Salinisphaera hydrothermalis TaxID=563188 RepID=UPI0033420018
MADHVFTIDTGHRCLDGHFPGAPIVPGVVLLEQVARAAGQRYGGRIRRIVRCKFVAVLHPDQACRVELVPKSASRFQFVCHGPDGCVATGMIEWSTPIDG